MLLCTPNLVHCWPVVEISSRSSCLKARLVRTARYSSYNLQLVFIGTNMLNVSAPPAIKTTTTAL